MRLERETLKRGKTTMDRREFIAASSALAATTLARPKPTSAQAVEGTRPGLRTITFNVLACNGYPKRKTNEERRSRVRSQMATRFALELGLYQPDIVSFQEAPPKDTVARIAEQMGMEFVFFPGGWEGNDDWPGGFPGAIMTCLPIIESENCPLARGRSQQDLFTRHWGRAVLQTNTEELAFYSAHLHPNDETIRAREVAEILAVMKQDLQSNRSFLFQGDLNHKPSDPEYKQWVEAGLIDTYAAKGIGQALTAPSVTPRSRIDYIWVRGPLAQRLRECRVLYEGAFRTNPDDPQSFALSDHIPVLAMFA